MLSDILKCDEGEFVNRRGQKLFCRTWSPSHQPPSKLVFLCHGLGDHSGRYDCIVKELVQKGCYVFTHDHVGHGRSEGTRVLVYDFQHFIDDIQQHTSDVKKKFPLASCYTVAHSLGATMAIMTCLQHEDLFKAIVLIAPAIQADPAVATPFRKLLARVVSRLLPELQVGSMDDDLMSRNKQEVESYKADPLCWQGGVKAKMATVLMDVMAEVEGSAASFRTPYLLLHGTHDAICLIDGSRNFHKLTSSSDKTFTEYQDAYHSLHHEPQGQGEQAVSEMSAWIMGH